MADQLIMKNGDLSDDVRSDVFVLQQNELINLTVDAHTVAASATGSFILQRSDDWVHGRASSATWRAVGSGVTLLALTGSTDEVSQEYRGLAGAYSVLWDHTSGGSGDQATIRLKRSAAR